MWRLLKAAVAAMAITALAATAPASANARDLQYAGISISSDDYALGVAWSKLAQKYLPDLDMTVAARGGTSKLLRGVADGDWDFGIIGAPHLLYARDGKFMFARQENSRRFYDNVRVILTFQTGVSHFVALADSDIESLADLRGRSIAIGTPGGFSGTMNVALLKAHGLDMNKGEVDGQYLEYSTALDQLRNGTLDAAYVWGGLPQGAVASTAVQRPLKYITLTADGAKKWLDTFPAGEYYDILTLTPEQIKNAYDGNVTLDKPALAYSTHMQVITNKSMPDDVVYKLTKTLWEHIDEVKDTSKILKGLSVEHALDTASALIHPGAERYYKEIGVLKK